MKSIDIIYSKGLTPDTERTTTISGLRGSITKEKGNNGLALYKAMCITKADNTNLSPLTLNQLLDVAFVCDTLYTDYQTEELSNDILFSHFHIKRLKD